MISLELTEKENQILAEARRQGEIYRKYAPQFDHTLDWTQPSEALFFIPEEADFPHVRNIARAHRAENNDATGADIVDALIYLEECWGGKVFYPRGEDGDMFNYAIGKILVKNIGDPEQIEKWAHKSADVAWAMTEPGAAGSDPSSMTTSARWDESANEWVINGEKVFISFASPSTAVTVMARATGNGLDGVVTPFIVGRDNPGLTVGGQMRKLGLRQWDTTGLAFIDCRVPDENRLQGNLKNALSTFNITRGSISAQALGVARAALDIVRETLTAGGVEIDYAAPLSERPAAVDRFMKLEELYESSWLTLVNAMWHKSNGDDAIYPTLSKYVGAGAVRTITRACIDLLGQDATSNNYFLEQAMRDSRVCDIYEGAGDVLRLYVARWLLGLKKSELN